MSLTNSTCTPAHVSERKPQSNHEIVMEYITKFPGLRFYQLKKETGFANGTLQHHINNLIKLKKIDAHYDNAIPRYFLYDIEQLDKIIIQRLSQNTTSKIIKLLLKKECQTFAQLVKYTKKSPGTVSLYKNLLLKDGIIKGDTSNCSSCRKFPNKIKYRLTDPEKVRAIVLDYGKTSLQQTADNLSDVFLAIK